MLPGVDDADIIALLPTPYDLIYRWNEFVPLADLLQICDSALTMTFEDEDLFGYVTMSWDDLAPYNVRVPAALVRDTWKHLKGQVRRRIEWPLINNRAFITDDEQDITEAMFRDTVGAALSVLLKLKAG